MGITIGKKKLKDGRISLFLDYNFKGNRKKEYLGLILQAPSNGMIRKNNKEKWQLASYLRAKRELEVIEAHFQIPRSTQAVQETDFFLFFEKFLSSYTRKDIKVVHASLKQLREFFPLKELPIRQINEIFCADFYNFLRNRLRGSTPTGYFKKFRMCLEQGVIQGFLPENPAKNVKTIHSEELIKDILRTEEIQRMALAPCKNREVKRAFLFACNSGLRWCDIRQLQYKSIDFPHKLLTITQQKLQGHSSKAVLHLNLNTTALHLLKPAAEVSPEERVFQLPSYTFTLRILKEWTRQAGLCKHITFHCARHSFITNIIIHGANIRTAASLAGHSSIHHTERYLHIVDELKQKAVDSLPELTIRP